MASAVVPLVGRGGRPVQSVSSGWCPDSRLPPAAKQSRDVVRGKECKVVASFQGDPTLELVLEAPVQRARLIPLAAVLTAGAVAGCGSSSSSSSSSATPKPASSSVQPSSTASASTAPTAEPVALVTTKPAKLGTILAFGPKKMTVYIFEADKGAASACTGACASAWPPVTGKPHGVGGAMAADLGSVKRPDGAMQVTYKGHPLYTFSKDKDDGDAYGQGVKAFGASWYVLAPSGKKIDNS
jgi:predicted lipoprotein with Yx(FWY)xxD motif